MIDRRLGFPSGSSAASVWMGARASDDAGKMSDGITPFHSTGKEPGELFGAEDGENN